MTGPIQPEQMQPVPLSKSVFEALSESDHDPVWKAFVHFMGNRNPANAAALSQWSDRTVAAVTDALAAVEQMRVSAAAVPKSIQAVARSFADLEDEFLEYIISGQQSETLLIVSYGPMKQGAVMSSTLAAIEDIFIEDSDSGSLSEDICEVSSGPKVAIRDILFVKKVNGLYFVGTNKALGIAGPYLSLDTCLSYVRSYMGSLRIRLNRINNSDMIPAAFIEDIIISTCPLVGTRFFLNRKICVRSLDTPYVHV
jgi:hypothetical protein